MTVRDLDAGLESALHYDELLIGTGASGISPRWPGIDAKGVLQLRTLDDAAEVERLLVAGARRAVVVGAGYIGLEVAEALLERGLHVTVVERLDAPMGAVLDADMATDVAGAMRAAGIDLRLGTAVTGFTVERRTCHGRGDGGRPGGGRHRGDRARGAPQRRTWRARRASAWASPAASRSTITCAPTRRTSGPPGTASNHTIA